MKYINCGDYVYTNPCIPIRRGSYNIEFDGGQHRRVWSADITLLLKRITPSSKSTKLGFKLEGIMSGVLLVEQLHILEGR